MEIDDKIYLNFIYFLVLVFNHDFFINTVTQKVSRYHESSLNRVKPRH